MLCGLALPRIGNRCLDRSDGGILASRRWVVDGLFCSLPENFSRARFLPGRSSEPPRNLLTSNSDKTKASAPRAFRTLRRFEPGAKAPTSTLERILQNPLAT